MWNLKRISSILINRSIKNSYNGSRSSGQKDTLLMNKFEFAKKKKIFFFPHSQALWTDVLCAV